MGQHQLLMDELQLIAIEHDKELNNIIQPLPQKHRKKLEKNLNNNLLDLQKSIKLTKLAIKTYSTMIELKTKGKESDSKKICTAQLCFTKFKNASKLDMSKWVLCDSCEQYFHYECEYIVNASDKLIIEEDQNYTCRNCKHETPFSTENLIAKKNKEEAHLRFLNTSKDEFESFKFEVENIQKPAPGTFLYELEQNCEEKGAYRALYFQEYTGKKKY